MLLPGTMFAGKRVATARQTATASPARWTYALRARLRAARLIRGRWYLVRLTATYADGRRQTLNVRIRG